MEKAKSQEKVKATRPNESQVLHGLDTDRDAQVYKDVSRMTNLPPGIRLAELCGCEDATAHAGDEEERIFLEIGGGTGDFAIHLAEITGAAVDSTDPEFRRLGHALSHKYQADRVRTQQGKPPLKVNFWMMYADDIHVYCKEEHYHACFANTMFHWIKPTDRPGVLRQILQVLKPGGFIGISTVDAAHPSLVTPRDDILSRQYGLKNSKLIDRLTQEELHSLLEGAGFEEVKITVEPFTLVFESGAEAVDFMNAATFGNFCNIEGLSPAQKSGALRDIEKEYEKSRDESGKLALANWQIMAVAHKSSRE